MKKYIWILIGLLALVAAYILCFHPDQIVQPNIHIGKLVFSDDFSGSSLDQSKWSNCYPGNNCTHPQNQELECYTPNNVIVNNGLLSLTARNENKICTDGTNYNYTSGLIQTAGKFSFTYGTVEVRAKTPAGKGFWPTVWLLPTDYSWPPELDALEQIGSIHNTNFMSLHYKQDDGTNGYTQQTFQGPDFTAGFHTYTMNWQPGVLTWYIDGHEAASYHNVYKVPSKPMYLLMNLAVGGSGPGAPDSSTPFPSSFQVDYVRVYK